METVKVDDLEMTVSDGYPCWVQMTVNNNSVSFTHDKIQMVIDALKYLKKDAKRSLKNTPYADEV